MHMMSGFLKCRDGTMLHDMYENNVTLSCWF